MDLSSLNPPQRQAVTTVHGPLLLLAGAGSGKTRVITHRIAYLLEDKRIPPHQILALTFTNKAAQEMKERVEKMVRASKELEISTFHSLCVRILRQYIHLLGYRRNFIIYDSQDQMSLVKTIFEDHDYESVGLIDPKGAHAAISQAKTEGKKPDFFLQQTDSLRNVLIGRIYHNYQETLKGCNAVDFDDLLNLTLQLFEEHPAELEELYQRYRFVLVDEYQDTNQTQYSLLKHITLRHKNLCVVGDDDQSIYGWRGADIRNILNFQNDFEKVTVIKLEQNYRSTQTILSAANQVISLNKERMEKTLWSDKGHGRLIGWIPARNEFEEMETVVLQIKSQILRSGRQYKDYAILYRSNFQSRMIEEAFREEGIPYDVVGGTNFYERREIKDALAYLRILHNTQDEVGLHRIINYPKRGIGKTSLMQAHEYCHSLNLPLFEVMKNASLYAKITAEAAYAMESLAMMLERYQVALKTTPLDEVFTSLLEEVGFTRELEKEKADTKTKEHRIQCVLELLQSSRNYMNRYPENTLSDYLERIALFSRDEKNEVAANEISLMTVHSAKGLEFPYVFIMGMADGLFPSKRALEEDSENEERRLCYVGITRAQKEITFSMAKSRRRFKEFFYQEPSRFLLDIDESLMETPVFQEESEHQQQEKTQNSRSQFFEQIRRMESDDF